MSSQLRKPGSRGPRPQDPKPMAPPQTHHAGPPCREALTHRILPGKPALLLPATGAQSPSGARKMGHRPEGEGEKGEGQKSEEEETRAQALSFISFLG